MSVHQTLSQFWAKKFGKLDWRGGNLMMGWVILVKDHLYSVSQWRLLLLNVLLFCLRRFFFFFPLIRFEISRACFIAWHWTKQGKRACLYFQPCIEVNLNKDSWFCRSKATKMAGQFKADLSLVLENKQPVVCFIWETEFWKLFHGEIPFSPYLWLSSWHVASSDLWVLMSSLWWDGESLLVTFHWIYKLTFHGHDEILNFFHVLIMFHVSCVSSLVMWSEVALWVHRGSSSPKVLLYDLGKITFSFWASVFTYVKLELWIRTG